jgi:hypothetical protein
MSGKDTNEGLGDDMEKSVEFKWHPEFEKSRASYSDEEVNDARFRWIKSVMYDEKLQKSASARNIAFALMDRFFNIHTGQCNPSVATLGALFNLKLTATKNMLKVLADAEWITIVQRFDQDNPKLSLSNQYRLEKIDLKRLDASVGAAKNDNHPQHNSEGGPSEFYRRRGRNSDGGVGRNSDHKPMNSEPHEENQRKNAGDKPAASVWPADAWDQFWNAYPNKVGKSVAKKSFVKIMRTGSATFEQIMDGLSAYKKIKPADRHWLNPATFLNQARWEDQPASVDIVNQQTQQRERRTKRGVPAI